MPTLIPVDQIRVTTGGHPYGVPGLLLRELWITADQRPERHTEQGLNAIVAGG